jgi:hypothetical protein
MTTGSLCLTEILMSWKSCSAKRLASHRADSASASGVALPCLASRRLSSEPALTPIRIGVPWSFAACAICLTWSSNLRMLPGFTRTAAQPASIAAKTYFGWKWMSAITGIWDLRAIAGSASASSWLGQATRTMSQPEAVSSAICWRVALTSEVSVVVMDWTEIGCSLPTPTGPTCSCRVFRRGARVGAGVDGIPRETLTTSSIHLPRRSPPTEAVTCASGTRARKSSPGQRETRTSGYVRPLRSWASCRVEECGSQVASSMGQPSAFSRSTTAGSSSITDTIFRLRPSRRSTWRFIIRAGR